MDIEFDQAKNDANRAKHGVDLGFARSVLSDPRRLTVLDIRFDYGEERYITYAKANGRIWVCIYTPRGNSYRVISLRKANDRETERYFAAPRRF